jgi:ATP-dependent helicase/nuclease subunit A
MQPSLFDLPGEPGEPVKNDPVDRAAREFAIDPANDVVLEASAGTGKTRVLVDRYVRLIEAEVEPQNILAITFTRKAAAEMRERVLAELARRAAAGFIKPARWRHLMDHVGDIQISTIDAFCFSLLREFPLEADVDPAFDVADETEMARFAREAMDRTLQVVRGLIADDESVRLLLAQVKTPTLVQAVGSLLDRRHVALPAIATFVRQHPTAGTAVDVGTRFVGRIRDAIERSPSRQALLADGPAGAPSFRWLSADLSALDEFPAQDPARVQQLRRRLERYFLTKSGSPRQRVSKPILPVHFANPDARRRHEVALGALSPQIHEALQALDLDVNALLARGLLRVVSIAARQYERLLADNALMDFAAMLARAVALLERQEEFARSRLKLQARYHHVLVDEFQDTSRLQWRLIELLIGAWGEGESIADAPTSIFIVGDRKQSIYRFRHAEVTLLDEAASRIGALRPGRQVRQSISQSFRAVPELLAFVNTLAGQLQGSEDLAERFAYRDADRFPVPDVAPGARRDGEPVLGLIGTDSMADSAAAVADEVARLIATGTVRDRSGAARAVQPDDIAILFRARAGHQYFEDALDARGIRAYVYKGLGFFDAPEVQDLQALLRYLAAPDSDLRAAELLRSRFVRLSDAGLTRLAPSFSRVLRDSGDSDASMSAELSAVDQAVLQRTRLSVARWLGLADRITPSELVDTVLRESAYAFELGGRRLSQARENVKKVRALIRRVESRGYATLGRLARYFDTLRAGDESNAIVEAAGAVNLMTMHAAKGLEFPIVFLVNLHLAGRGRPAGFSVIERGPDGEPEVAFNSTAATMLEERRENEELRRLLYVAVTRARDRLYLAAEVDRGKFRKSARSLASLFPEGLADLFAVPVASPDATEAVWTTGDDSFAFRVCRSTERQNIVQPHEDVADEVPIAVPQPLIVPGQRFSAAALQPFGTAGTTSLELRTLNQNQEPGTRNPEPYDHRLLGTLVHRLFQRQEDPATDEQTLASTVSHLLTPDERVDVHDVTGLSLAAARTYRAFRLRPDVDALLGTGACHFEVPFSFEPPGRPGDVVRGMVDCLIIGPDGSATVLEFKTGGAHPEHQAQAALYGEAMSALLGLPTVRVNVLYS